MSDSWAAHRWRTARDLDPPFGPDHPKPDRPEILTLDKPSEARLWDCLGEGWKVATRLVVDSEEGVFVEFCTVTQRDDPDDPEMVQILYDEPMLYHAVAFPIVVIRGMPLPG